MGNVVQGWQQNLKIAVLAWISIPVALGISVVIDWAFHDWMRWIEFAVFTALMFGGLAVRLGDDMKQSKCPKSFSGLFLLHVAVFVYVLRSGFEIRTAWYVPIVFVESFVFGLILTGPGGADSEEDDVEDKSRIG